MKTKNGTALPARLNRGRKQFERWRATRQKRRDPGIAVEAGGGTGSGVRGPSDVAGVVDP